MYIYSGLDYVFLVVLHVFGVLLLELSYCRALGCRGGLLFPFTAVRSPYGEIRAQYFSENAKGENHLGDLGEDGGNLYLYRTETGCVGVVWTHADKWRALENTVMNCLHLCGEPTQMHMLKHILLISCVFRSRLRLSSGAAQDYW